jgi:hypothetical protein
MVSDSCMEYCRHLADWPVVVDGSNEGSETAACYTTYLMISVSNNSIPEIETNISQGFFIFNQKGEVRPGRSQRLLGLLTDLIQVLITRLYRTDIKYVHF